MDWLVIIEPGERSFGVYVPDLPGCVAAADTREEVIELIREAIVMHLEAMREQGEPPPLPQASAETIHVAA